MIATSLPRNLKDLNYVWGRLLRYAPWPLAGTLLLMLGRMAIQFAPALVIRSLFDTLTATSQFTPELWALIALLVGVALARVVILISATWAQATMSYLYAALLRVNALEHIVERPGALTPTFAIGDTVNRLGHDAWQVAAYLNFTLLEGLGVVTLVWAIYLMARVDPWVTLAALAPLAIAALIAQRSTARLEQLQQVKRNADGAVSTFLGEIFGAVQAVQVAGATHSATAHLQQLNQTRRRAVLQERMFQDVIMASLINNVGHIATGTFLLLAASKMRAGSFTLGDFALFTYLLPVMSDFIMAIGMVVAHYKQAGVSSVRLQELMEQEFIEQELMEAEGNALTAYRELDFRGIDPVTTPAPPPLLTSLAFEGITYRHPTSGRGIAGASFTVTPGTLTVLTGRVGSGKSTLLRALLGQLPAQAGTIRWNGDVISDPASFLVPPRAAYVPQAPRLLSASLQENILMDRAPEQLPAALHSAVMENDIAAFPEGLATVVGPRGMRLSGGQLQRSAAARALIGPPTLLVVDDLSSALDVATEATLWQRLRSLPGVTILAVSTRRITFHQADQIIVLRDGVIEAAGPLESLLESSQEMRYLVQAATSESKTETSAGSDTGTNHENPT